ncbi:hypothetical protein K469DRAFT_710258 [Zopfia rhizophila CBS 207.26]|uniref:Uncharacterized protein n=1 Tax=Zopfia rhizophila CBS 207.26 TaxID=1314779 RepID=A0A6A6D849_9PEZI|nr:hypothetical protein K469DRAFT_710583 [Zopfia rhizophila CBS 207.26]KAF2183881.1 hypothetical protein K469DRAFT_710258 [Zopfia rhizophila CBS 207.26]
MLEKGHPLPIETDRNFKIIICPILSRRASLQLCRQISSIYVVRRTRFVENIADYVNRKEALKQVSWILFKRKVD